MSTEDSMLKLFSDIQVVHSSQKSKRNLGAASDLLDCGVVSLFLGSVDFQTWYVFMYVHLHE